MVQKKVIIVGASSGTGREIACKYAEKGWRVGITARRENLLYQIKEKYPDLVCVSCFDVTGSQNMYMIDDLIGKLGGLDLLLYNSGYGEPSIELVYDTEIDTTLTNVNGFVSIVSHAFNYFVKQGHGQIAVTSSVAALRGGGWAPSYHASKAFMSVYAESLNIKAKKLKKDIVVTDIRPGFMDTKMARGNSRFWVSPVNKAAKQIIAAIRAKKRIVYITHRWWLVAQIIKLLPFSVYRRIG